MGLKLEGDERVPFVSVVIPTFNRKKLLEKCLNSLFKVDYPKSKFEVIVVDNGSTDDTVSMVRRKFPKVKVVIENRRSGYSARNRSFARNTGCKYATGQIVAFTDDDCIVDRGWLKNLTSGFFSEKIGAVGGPLYSLLHPKSICDKFEGTPVGSFHYGSEKKFVEELITANLAVKYEVLEKNRFDEASLYELEDIDFCKSLTESGLKLLYVPDAIVYHKIDPKRVTIRHILKRAFFEGISFYFVERKRSNKTFLAAKFLRKSLDGLAHFFLRRRIRDFFWFAKCSVGFLISVLLFNI